MKKKLIKKCAGKMCGRDCYSCYYGKNGWYLEGDRKWYCTLHDMPMYAADSCDDYREE